MLVYEDAAVDISGRVLPIIMGSLSSLEPEATDDGDHLSLVGLVRFLGAFSPVHGAGVYIAAPAGRPALGPPG